MKKIFLACMIVLIVGCSSPTQISTDLPFATQTNTLIPTSTPKPATPTVTPFPPLQTNGPYFSYFRKIGEEYQLVMLDSDGKGRKEISFPQEIQDAIANQEFYPSMQLVSPDGKWIAYFAGTAGKFPLDQTNNLGPFDLKLNLLNLTNLETEASISLLSQDYPNNFVEAEKQINDPYINAITLQGTFVIGITKAIAWSPDGKYLAFAGQMDGLSSDLYVYEIETKTIRRLSSGLQQLQWINWSPDGQKILYASTYLLGMETVYDVYSVDFDGSNTIKLSSSTSNATNIEWLNSETYIENDNANVLGAYNLRLVNCVSGRITSIWKGSYTQYSIDSNQELLIISAFLPDIDPFDYFAGATTDTTSGLYLINLSTLEKNKIELESDGDYLKYRFHPFNLNDQKFILLGEGVESYFLSKNLALIPIDFKNVNVSVSPNQNLWVGINNQSINVYSQDNILINSLPISIQYPIGNRIVWNVDSSGFFLLNQTEVYFVNIQNNSISLLETNLFTDHRFQDYSWVTN